MIKHDGHVHSPYCPHGTNDSFELYIEHAIKNNLSAISFTEHAPLPRNFIDPTPLKDSAMKWEDLPNYLGNLQLLKTKYKEKISIYIGLEVDYIEGFETETTELLNEVGPLLDDSILSVHFLKKNNTYSCVDYSPEVFKTMIAEYGSIEALYSHYFETVKKSIEANLGIFKPKRIGHITLVHKFQKKYKPKEDFTGEILRLLDCISVHKLMLDYNSAGFSKPLCLETYPPDWVIDEAIKRKIPLIYGSDAHSAKGILLGSEQLKKGIHFTSID